VEMSVKKKRRRRSEVRALVTVVMEKMLRQLINDVIAK